jgi:hypothetical protein
LINDSEKLFRISENAIKANARKPAKTLANPTPVYEYSGIRRRFNSVFEKTRISE